MFQPEYTMHGFNWHDQRGVEGIGFVRALRTLLTQHLPSIMPSLRGVIAEELVASLGASTTIDGIRLFHFHDHANERRCKTCSSVSDDQEACHES